MKFNPHPYQHDTLDWLFKQTLELGHAGGMLFLEPGLGKTVTTMTWFNGLRRCGMARMMMIVAPVRVRDNVWPNEATEWDHLVNDIHVQVVGSGKWKDLRPEVNVVVVNPESLAGFVKWAKKNNLNPDTLVVDESGDFRNWSSTRSKLLRKIVPELKWRLCLTATPVPESPIDIFMQSWIIDQGESLGKNITAFRKVHCYRGGFEGKTYLMHRGEAPKVAEKIRHLALYGTVAGNLNLPELSTETHVTVLDSETMDIYKHLQNPKKEELLLPNGETVIPKNAGAKRNLLRQICSGGVYDEAKVVHELHEQKVEMLRQLVQGITTPIMVAYQYDHDLSRIRNAYPDIEVIRGQTTPNQARVLIERWNRDDVPMLAVQPQALSHGVNMQRGSCGTLIWFTLPDSLLVFKQLNTRIWRQGVSNPVVIHQIVTRATVDRNMAANLERKSNTQKEFLCLLPRIGAQVDEPTSIPDECIF